MRHSPWCAIHTPPCGQDADLWDEETRNQWSSNTKRGITKADWEMNIADSFQKHRLHHVPTVARTSMSFERIDLDNNGRVNRREFDSWHSTMKQMPRELREAASQPCIA